MIGYKLVGDVDYAGCRQAASQITPVSAVLTCLTKSAWYTSNIGINLSHPTEPYGASII